MPCGASSRSISVAADTTGPGGQPGTTLIQRGRLNPEHRHFGQATPGPTQHATPTHRRGCFNAPSNASLTTKRLRYAPFSRSPRPTARDPIRRSRSGSEEPTTRTERRLFSDPAHSVAAAGRLCCWVSRREAAPDRAICAAPVERGGSCCRGRPTMARPGSRFVLIDPRERGV